LCACVRRCFRSHVLGIRFAEDAGMQFFSERTFFGEGGEGRRVVEGAGSGGEDGGDEEKAGGGSASPDGGGGGSSPASLAASSGEPDDSPAPLLLSFDGRELIPQTMFVEVKSANDRLDSRQEDWLCILESGGVKARVCKFLAKKKEGKGKKEPAKKAEKIPELTAPFTVRRVTEGGVTEREFKVGAKAEKCYQMEMKTVKKSDKFAGADCVQLWKFNELIMNETKADLMISSDD